MLPNVLWDDRVHHKLGKDRGHGIERESGRIDAGMGRQWVMPHGCRVLLACAVEHHVVEGSLASSADRRWRRTI
jgi:hypothetical protein